MLQGRRIKSVTTHLIVQHDGQKEAAVNQTVDLVASHTGSCWLENAGGLYPYLQTKYTNKVKAGPDNNLTSRQLLACAGRSDGNANLNAQASRAKEPPRQKDCGQCLLSAAANLRLWSQCSYAQRLAGVQGAV